MHEGCSRRERVLSEGTTQVLLALMVVHMILVSAGFLFGREIGPDIVFLVCGGISLFATTYFLMIFLLDRSSAARVDMNRRWKDHRKRIAEPGKDDR